jgi:hypothetical protein
MNHETVSFRVMDDHHAALFSKYSKRGWRQQARSFREDPSQEQDMLYGLQGERRIGDPRHSWVMRLDTSGVARPEKPDFVIEVSKASLR